MSTDFRPLLYYFARSNRLAKLSSFCKEQIDRRGRDVNLVFWKAYAAGRSGQLAEAIRELESLRSTRRDMTLPLASALLYFHKAASTVDREQVEMFEAMIPTALDITSAAGKLVNIRFLILVGELAEARRYLQPLLSTDAMASVASRQGGIMASYPAAYSTTEAFALQCWLAVAQHQQEPSEASHNNLLETRRCLLDYGGDDIEILMAKASCLFALSDYDQALDTLNHAFAAVPTFYPALLERAKLLAAVQDWDQALDAATRALEMEPGDPDALRILAVHLFTQEVRLDDAVNKLNEFKQNASEPVMLIKAAALFSRICGRNEAVLNICCDMLELALRRVDAPHVRAVASNELGLVFALLNQPEEAIHAFKEASRADHSNVHALLGTLRCQVMQGHFEHAATQLEFVSTLHESIHTSPQLPLLKALIRMRMSKPDFQQADSLLRQAKDLLLEHGANPHLSVLATQDPLDVYIHDDPDFTLEVASCMFTAAAAEHGLSGNPTNIDNTPASSLTQQGVALLDKLAFRAPAVTQSYVLKARAFITLSKFDDARRCIRRCLEIHPRHTAAHLLEAQICIIQENFRGAESALDEALAYNFAVRSCVLYKLIKAQLSAKQGASDEALHELQEAIQLPEARQAPTGLDDDGMLKAGSFPTLTASDRVQLFIQYATRLADAGRLNEAQRTLGEALQLFKGTSHEASIVEARATYLMNRGDLDQAMQVLNGIPPTSPGYLRAAVLRGQIALKRRDKAGFVNCYKTLVRTMPSVDTYVMLGEAYMSILAPDSAIKAFEEALQFEQIPSLQIRLGRAYVATHNYHHAEQFYEDSLRANPYDVDLRLDLAKLRCRLRRFASAIRVLKDCPIDRILDKTKHVQVLAELADVYQHEDPQQALEPLKTAIRLQKEFIAQLNSSVGFDDDNAKREASSLLASLYRRQGDASVAIGMFKEAILAYQTGLTTDPQNMDVHLDLAKLLLQQDKVEEAIQQCEAALRIKPSAQGVVLLLSEAYQRDRKFDAALAPMEAYLKFAPNDYEVLAHAIQLQRRCGKLSDASALIAAAENADKQANIHAGLRYCKGLFFRYSYDVTQAVFEFNKSRRDVQWGERALIQLIELYLNPEQDALWEQASDAGESSSNTEAVEQFIQELAPICRDKRKLELLEGYYWLATRSPINRAKATQRFVEISEDKTYLPGLLAVATVFMIDGAQQKAKNLLKSVAKGEYNPQYSEEYEFCVLRLAKFYIENGKFDMAQECCQRCLTYNKSCGSAWEHMGAIMEREQSYIDAARCYEHAWNLYHHMSAPIGYKLAFNYLKAERYTDAIEVCDQVLQHFPDYPIREQVLDKAIALLYE